MIKYKVIIYDFDGVILDSVDIKTNAFLEIYKNCNESEIEAIKEYHLAHGGISRYKKFEYFEEFILNKKVDKNYIEKLAFLFEKIVKKRILEVSYIKFVEEFLKFNFNKTKQYICTGTPQKEIEQIIKQKGINNFFTKIYGYPKSKEEIIKLILDDSNELPENCLYLGDSLTDFQAANKFGVPFIGIKNSHTKFPEGTIVIDDFEYLLNNFQ